MTEQERLQSKYAALGPVLNERECRLWAAAEARALGRGGVTLVAQATGITRKRIHTGLRELATRAESTPATAKPQQQRHDSRRTQGSQNEKVLR